MANISFSSIFSVKKPDSDKAKRIICALLQANDGVLSGTTRLYKAFYAAHLFHWENADGILSEYPIARMPRGPGIDAGDQLLAEMCREGLISVEIQQNGPYPESVYSFTGVCESQLDEDELKSVARAVEWVKDVPATQLSNVTHELSRSWISGQNGDILDIYSDTLSDADHKRIQQCQDKSKALIDSVFGSSDVGSTS